MTYYKLGFYINGLPLLIILAYMLRHFIKNEKIHKSIETFLLVFSGFALFSGLAFQGALIDISNNRYQQWFYTLLVLSVLFFILCILYVFLKIKNK